MQLLARITSCSMNKGHSYEFQVLSTNVIFLSRALGHYYNFTTNDHHREKSASTTIDVTYAFQPINFPKCSLKFIS